MNKVTPLWRWIALSIAATFLLPFGQAFANFSMMDDPGCPGRVSNGLILLYNFSENNDVTVNDISGYGTPLTAHIENPNKITWMQPCGVNITGSKIISNSGANKVSSRIKQTNSITVETWVKTSNAWQYGPARVITISENTSLRNFTLGQQDDDWVIRYKTNNTDGNGTPESKAVNKVKTEWQHVVYTRASNGKERIYIDGVKVYEGYRYGNSNNWGEHCKLAIGDEMSNDRQWKGMVNLVAVYDRALTATEINQNYTFGSCCSASNGEVSIECQNDINVTAAAGQSNKL
ncbi:MAG: LamG domain-containing protein [Saprospiraceae bacterium]